MTNIEKIKQLAGAVDADLQEDVESVILNAGKYVAAVITMECAALNLQNRKGDEYRNEVSRTDAARSRGIMRLLMLLILPINWPTPSVSKNLHWRSRTPRLRRFCLCRRARNLR